MSLASSLAGAIAGALGAPSGELVKAKLHVIKSDTRASPENIESTVTFQFNPEQIAITRTAAARTPAAPAPTSTIGNTPTAPPQVTVGTSTLKLDNIIFDSYIQKTSGATAGASIYPMYIEPLEKLLMPNDGKHAPAKLLFAWGKLTDGMKGPLQLACWLEAFTTTYTMFMKDGTPVRAKCSLTLRTGDPPEAPQKNSPDHAKLVTVIRGQSLADIAFMEYDDVGEWRRIADANGIDNPLVLQPGTRLLVPPILKR